MASDNAAALRLWSAPHGRHVPARWLAQPDRQLKGGWGPGSQPGVSGGYLDRQMGVVTVGGRKLAVAIASAPSDGSHTTGTSNLTAIARWLVAHADAKGLPGRHPAVRAR